MRLSEQAIIILHIVKRNARESVRLYVLQVHIGRQKGIHGQTGM